MPAGESVSTFKELRRVVEPLAESIDFLGCWPKVC